MHVGLLSKITRNCCTSTLKSSPLIIKPFPSPLHLCSSPSHLWKTSSRNGTIQSGGSILARTIFFKKIPTTMSNRRLSHSFTSPNTESQRRSIFRRLTRTDGVLIGLIAANVAVFILWKVADYEFMRQHFTFSLDNFQCRRWHTFITYAFSHELPFHLIDNMIQLYIFGKSIGENFGTQYMLKLYLGGAITGSIVGSIFYLLYHFTMIAMAEVFQLQGYHMQITICESEIRRIQALGASGAVNAVFMLYIFLSPNLLMPVPRILLGSLLMYRDCMRICQGDLSGAVHLGGTMVAGFAWLSTRKGRFGRF